MTQLIIARKALGPSLSPGGGLEALPGFRWSFSHPVPWDSGMWLSPIPPQLPCWPSKAGHRPSCSLAPVLGLFFGISSLAGGGRDAARCSVLPAAHLEREFGITWMTTGGSFASKMGYSQLGRTRGPHTVPARAHPLSQLPWELPARLPVDNTPARRISWGFLLAVVSWWRPRGAHFGSGGDDNGGCFLARGFSRPGESQRDSHGLMMAASR